MTFDKIVQRVMDRMNLSDAVARARIGESVNERYTWLCTSMGLQTSAQRLTTSTAVIGSDEMVFGPSPVQVAKVEMVFNQAFPKPNNLGEVSLDTLRLMVLTTEPPMNYAIYLTGDDTVTIKIDCVPTTNFVLSAWVIENKATLNGSDVPTFNEGYHNVLYYGAMATEYDKMEKDEKAQEFEGKFEQRCSELRLFIAKSTFKDIYQGKNSPGPVLVNRLV